MYDKAIDKRKEGALSMAYFEYLLKEAKIEAETLLMKAKEIVSYFQKNFSDQNVRFEDEYGNDLLIHLEVLYNNMQILFDKAKAADFQNYGRLRYFMENFYKEIHEYVALADVLPPQQTMPIPKTWPVDKDFSAQGFYIRYVSHLNEEEIKNLPRDTFVVEVMICSGDFNDSTEYFTVTVNGLNLQKNHKNLHQYARYCIEDSDNVEFYWARLGGHYLFEPRIIYNNGKEWSEVTTDELAYSEGSFDEFGIYKNIVYFDGKEIISYDYEEQNMQSNMNESKITVHSPNTIDTNVQCSTREEMLQLASKIPFNFYIDGNDRIKVDIDTPNHEGAAFIEPDILYLGNMPIRNIHSQSFGVAKDNQSLLMDTLMRVMDVNSKMKFGTWIMEERDDGYFFKVCIHSPVELEHHLARYLTLAVTVFFDLYDDIFGEQGEKN